jgi:5-methyltetrahydrofolate--homocysteine methyltransferase
MQQGSRFLQTVYERVVIYDGATGTNLQKRNLTAQDYGGAALEGCNEALILTRPDVIEDLHASFLEVGVDVIETDSFTGSRLKLDEYGLGDRTHEINFTAAQLARKVADRFSTADHPRFVAGSIGPTGMLPSSSDPLLSKISYSQLLEIFREQARALIEGGADVLLIETSQDILEVRAAISGIRQAFVDLDVWRPIQAQVTLDTSGRMLLGTDIGAVMAILVNLGVDIIGMNCSTGPEHMRQPVTYLSEHCPLPISTIPNAGLPLNINGQAVYPETPEAMASALAAFVSELGVSVVGGCCGNSPDHLRAVVNAIRSLPAEQQQRPVRRLLQSDGMTNRPLGIQPDPSLPRRIASVPLVASGIRAASLLQEPRPMVIGERVNAQGSRKIKQALLKDDYDTLTLVARDQMEWGAHALDVQVALTERPDEADQMRQAIRTLSMGVEAPLVIDSTEASVIRAALETYPGRAIINSINMENGRQRIDDVLPLVREHGAAVIALTIDEIGMARTADRKVAIAHTIHDIVTCEYGLPSEALIFDVLTFPLTTGQEDLRHLAVETLDGIRRVKAELPDVLTVLGVSNVSFGVATHARAALNSVFLYHAVAAGLDLAIVNPSHITPYAEIDAEQRKICDDLIFDTDPDALPRFIAYYEEHGAAQNLVEERTDPMEGMTVEQKIHYMILHRKKEGIESLIDQAIATSFAALQAEMVHSETEPVSYNEAAVQVLNNVLLPAMKDVGDRFGAGELILPFVLQSAEVMKKSVAHLEQYLERQEGYTKGRVVLATVYGDVHDIGKNLVNTILSNNGYTVYDLGKQVPLNTIIEKAVEVNADAIGLSALLVSTSKQMPLCVRELHQRGLRFPVIVGGAAINRAYGQRILWVGDEESARQPYAPGVFYARDAFEGLDLMDQIVDPGRYSPLVERIVHEAEVGEVRATALQQRRQEQAPTIGKPTNRAAVSVPNPPFWGSRVLDRVAPEDVAFYLDRNALFRGRWGGKSHGEDYERLVRDDFEPRLADLLRRARTERTLDPRAIYGYYPCWSEGDSVIVLDPADHTHEVARFTFPRQSQGERLCLADYFALRDSRSSPDVIAFQVVTMGERATEQIDALQSKSEYSAAFYIHGLSVQMAEAMADYVNAQIRRELGMDSNDSCRRYSWGYAAIPDLEDHQRLFDLLPVTESIGVALTDAFQLVPEQSTAALVVHNPAATYFSVRD